MYEERTASKINNEKLQLYIIMVKFSLFVLFYFDKTNNDEISFLLTVLQACSKNQKNVPKVCPNYVPNYSILQA